jgi:hypothetical protein
MRLDNALCDVALVYRPYATGELKLGLHLIHHRFEHLVGAVQGTERDRRGLMGKPKAGVLGVGAQPRRHGCNANALRVFKDQRSAVELERVPVDYVEVVRLGVDLLRVDPCGQYQRGVHFAPATIRKIR